MKEYIKAGEIILMKGFRQEPARAGMIGTRVYSALQMRYDLSKSQIPILTTKEVAFKAAIAELLWMLRGETHIKPLIESGCNVWNDNAWKWANALRKHEGLDIPKMTYDEFVKEAVNDNPKVYQRSNGETYTIGELGRIYGYQLRRRKGIDQLRNAINLLIENPTSRQNKVVCWVPEDMNYEYCAQPNCHGDFSFTGRSLDAETRLKLLKNKLNSDKLSMNIGDINTNLDHYRIPRYEFSLKLYQRSGDYALGIPFNILEYSVMMYIVAILTNTVPKMLVMTIDDAHLYADHIVDFREVQCRREPLELPTFTIKGRKWQELAADFNPEFKDLDLFLANLNPNDFKLENYKHHDKINYRLHTGIVSL